jgi:hypothetical protein
LRKCCRASPLGEDSLSSLQGWPQPAPPAAAAAAAAPLPPIRDVTLRRLGENGRPRGWRRKRRVSEHINANLKNHTYHDDGLTRRASTEVQCRRRPRSTPLAHQPLPPAAPSSCATGSCTAGVPEATVCASLRQVTCVARCGRSSTPRHWVGTSGGTRPSPAPGARCGGRVCPQPSLNTCGLAPRASVSRPTPLPAPCSPSPCRRAGAAASAWTFSSCPRL